jgi:hypothetical protein
MIQAYSKREIRNTLYSLKKEWGCLVQYYHIVEKQRDIKTGVSSTEYQVLTIKRAILLPSLLLRELAARTSSPFNYGGDFNNKDRFIIIDAKDFKISLDDIAPNDYVVINADKYSIKHMENFDFSTAYVFKINQIPPKDL